MLLRDYQQLMALYVSCSKRSAQRIARQGHHRSASTLVWAKFSPGFCAQKANWLSTRASAPSLRAASRPMQPASRILGCNLTMRALHKLFSASCECASRVECLKFSPMISPLHSPFSLLAEPRPNGWVCYSVKTSYTPLRQRKCRLYHVL